jgi:transcriptional regulator with XRE-family HTH domain
MSERSDWADLRDRRMAEPGAKDAYQATRLAYELGRAVRELRERRVWTQTDLARAAGMTRSAVACFEAGGTVPTLPVLDRLAQALDADLNVSVTPRTESPDALRKERPAAGRRRAEGRGERPAIRRARRPRRGPGLKTYRRLSLSLEL